MSSGESVGAAWFEAFYRRHPDDPWGLDSRWYEVRKRRVLLASLPREELGDVLEIGCATGAVTERLARRASSVLAVDAAAEAVERTAERMRDAPDVAVRRARLPDEWPEGRFDLVVLAEVGYYLSREDLDRTLERIRSSLAPTGVVAACHWRHPIDGAPLRGDDVHAALRTVPGWRRTVAHEEEDFLLDVMRPEGTRSVAQEEGIA